jgi:DNA-binding transcriptional ArsR family regulator
VPVPRRREDVEHDKSRRDDVLEALRRICPTGDTVSSGVWQDTSAEVGLDRSTFYAHKKALLEAGLVDQSGDGRSTRFAPRASSESNPLRDGGGLDGLILGGLSEAESRSKQFELDGWTEGRS